MIYIVFWILIFFKVIKNICNFYQPILWNYNLCKLCINISVDQEGRKKPTEFPLITRVDIFPSVSVWIKVIDFIKIYILFRSLKLKVIRRHITGKKNLEIKKQIYLDVNWLHEKLFRDSLMSLPFNRESNSQMKRDNFSSILIFILM